MIRRQLINKYNKYYRHWTDFNILVAIVAFVGAILSILNWDESFMRRGTDGTNNTESFYVTRMLVLLTTIFGLFAIIMKFWLEANWQNYKNPIAFYKTLVNR